MTQIPNTCDTQIYNTPTNFQNTSSTTNFQNIMDFQGNINIKSNISKTHDANTQKTKARPNIFWWVQLNPKTLLIFLDVFINVGLHVFDKTL